jgi:hypothetical protein
MNTSARPADGAKDQKPKPKQDHKPDQKPLTLTLSRRERGLIEVFGRASPTCDTALNSGSEKQTNQPLAMRKRGLIEVIGRATPTCDTALNSGSEKQTNQPLALQEKERND